MVTVAANDGNPVSVVVLVPGLSVSSKLFGTSRIKGKFAQSGSEDDPQFFATHALPHSDLVLRLTEWTLGVECKFRDRSEDLKYFCRRFPSSIIPSEARYEITKGKIALKLPKADPSQSWAGDLYTNGLDQSSSS